MTTLLALKNRKAELRAIMRDAETDGQFVSEEIFIEFQTVSDQLINADRELMRPVDKCVRCKWYHE